MLSFQSLAAAHGISIDSVDHLIITDYRLLPGCTEGRQPTILTQGHAGTQQSTLPHLSAFAHAYLSNDQSVTLPALAAYLGATLHNNIVFERKHVQGPQKFSALRNMGSLANIRP